MLFNSNYCCVNCNSFFEIILIIEFELRFRKKKFKKQFLNIKSIKNYNMNHFLIYSFLKIVRKKITKLLLCNSNILKFLTNLSNKTNIF